MITACLQGYDRTPPRAMNRREIDIVNARPFETDAGRLVLDCLRDTATTRQIGFGVQGYIPWDRVMEWCDRHGVDEDLANMVWDALYTLESDRIKRESAKLRDELESVH